MEENKPVWIPIPPWSALSDKDKEWVLKAIKDAEQRAKEVAAEDKKSPMKMA